MTRWIRLAVAASLLGSLAACNAAARDGVPAAPSASAGGCPRTLAITPADGNRTLCVALGGTVTVTLDTPAGVRWSPVESTGTALSAKAGGAPPPTQTSAGATFTAVAQGTSVISSFRPNCPPTSGGVQCHSIMAWHVDVQVK